jgi:hypothetical protein
MDSTASDHGEQVEMTNLILKIKRFLKAFSWITVAAFGYLNVGHQDFLRAVSSVPARVITRVALVVYFSSWCFGPLSDLQAYDRVFPKAPTKLAWNEIGAMLVIWLTFLLLCYCRDNEIALILSCLGFMSADFVAAQFILRPNIERAARLARETAPGELVKDIQVEVVVQQNVGPWRWIRFYAGFSILILAAVIAIAGLPEVIGSKLGLEPKLVIPIIFLTFVLGMEGSMWERRLRRDAILNALKDGLIRLQRPVAAPDPPRVSPEKRAALPAP